MSGTYSQAVNGKMQEPGCRSAFGIPSGSSGYARRRKRGHFPPQRAVRLISRPIQGH